MNKLKSTLVGLLIISIVLVSFPQISVVKAQSTIWINEDGSVEGTDKIQGNGNVYTFTGNVTGSINVEKDNAVIDGTGFTLQASEKGAGIGIQVYGTENVTIKSLCVRSFKTGVYFYSSQGGTVSGNHVIDNGELGVYIQCSDNCSIYGNSIENTTGSGIQLCEAYNNSVYNNNVAENGVGIEFGSGGAYNLVFQNQIISNNYAFTSWGSSRNIIYENNIINNTNQVHIWLSSNDWDFNGKGNYWSIYNGTDSDGDGVGDTPYKIDTSPEDYEDADSYPLTNPVDIQTIPEFPSWLVVALFLAITVFGLVVRKQIRRNRLQEH